MCIRDSVKDVNGLTILEHDEYIRPDTDMQKLGALKAAFQDIGEGMPGFDKVALMKYPEIDKISHIHHAGNSSGIVDGAAGILIGDQEFGKALGLNPRAKIRATCKWVLNRRSCLPDQYQQQTKYSQTVG